PMVAAAGESATFALVALAAIMLCIAFSFSQLTRVMPNAGSSFSWIASAFGREAGSYAAWLLLLSNYFATMTTALPAAAYTLDLFAPALATSPFWDALVAAAWIAASTLLLFFGLRPTAFTTAIFLLAELGVVGASAVAALLVHPAPESYAAAAQLPLPNPALGIVTAMVLAIWMTDGWEVSAAASEEATGPPETPGRGGVVALVLTTAILVFAMAAYLHVGSVAGFSAHQTDAMGYVADRLGGPIWHLAIVVTVLVSTAATLWTTVLYLSRSVFAMGRDGVLPRAVGRLDRRSMPTNALALVFVCVTGFTLLTGFWPTAASALNLVLSGTSVFLGMLFCLSALAAIRLLARAREVSRWQRILVPAFGALALAAIIGVDIAGSDAFARAIELGGLALGIPFAFWRGAGMRLARPAVAGEGLP
ncbi:MAG: APC family permease, partial [Candidatus Eremiobacteraeota bacterium]|nr:APC family permease [Candidatus Eremiobacteraeota bacterium]